MKLLTTFSALVEFAKRTFGHNAPLVPPTEPPDDVIKPVAIRLPNTQEHLRLCRTKTPHLSHQAPEEDEEPTWSSSPLSSPELYLFTREDTKRIGAVAVAPPPQQLHLPIKRHETTGLDFVRMFMQENENVLDCMENIIHKHLRKQTNPKLIYMHSQDYDILRKQYFEVYHAHMPQTCYPTMGLYRQPVQVAIYLADLIHIDLPRGVLICQ